MPEQIPTVLLIVLVLVALYAAHKARRTHQATLRIHHGLHRLSGEIHSLYQQLQAYDSVMRLLGLTRPLPMLRGWAASPDFLLHVCEHALDAKPQVILEFGSGASTIALAQCVRLNGSGRVVSIDHDASFAQQTRMLLERHGLTEHAAVHAMPLVPMADRPDLTWYAMSGLDAVAGRVDMVIVDGPPQDTGLARYPALHALQRFMAGRATVFLDDADRPSEREAVSRWQREFAGLEISRLPAEKGCVRLVVDAGLRTPVSTAAG